MTREYVAYYAKGIIAVLGAMVTSALGIIAPDTDLFIILTILSAGLTAAGVILVPNGARPVGVDGKHEA